MPGRSNSAYQIKLGQVFFGLAFLALGLLAVRSAMSGSYRALELSASLVIGFAAVLALDRHYWVLLPLSTALNIRLPGLPFKSSEIGCLLVLTTFFVRSGFHRNRNFSFFSRQVGLAAPYFLWACFIFFLNPTGLHILGNKTIGARFYFDILLGFSTLVVLSRIEFSECDLKWVFWLLLVGSAISVCMGYFDFLQNEVTERTSRYYLIPMGTIFLLLICRFDLASVLFSFKRFICCVGCSLLVIYSGKRTTVGQIILAPFLLVLLRGREKMLAFVGAVVVAFFVAFAVAGHGNFFTLPYSVQRSLSFLPGRWESSLLHYGFQDLFREDLQRRAKEIAFSSPWMGRKGFSMDVNEIAWQEFGGASHADEEGHAMVGNWHNKFWGMWADFGVFAPLSWYFFAIGAFVWAIRQRHLFPGEDAAAALYRYWTLLLAYDLVFAFGHSGLTPFQQWPVFGCLLALCNMRSREPSRAGASQIHSLRMGET